MKKSIWLVPLLVFIATFFAFSTLLGGGCADGWGSGSIGLQGACSHHGGVISAGGLALLISLGLSGYCFFILDKHEARKFSQNRANVSFERWFSLQLFSAPFNPQEHYFIEGDLLTYEFRENSWSATEVKHHTLSHTDLTQIEALGLRVITHNQQNNHIGFDGLTIDLHLKKGKDRHLHLVNSNAFGDNGSDGCLLLKLLEGHFT